MWPTKRLIFALAIGTALAGPAWAEDPATSAPTTAPANEPAASAPPAATTAAPPATAEPAGTPEVTAGGSEDSPPVTTKKPKTKRGRSRAREKEAEGTEAPNRFEADTVIKSQYKLDGQPLEVDPD